MLFHSEMSQKKKSSITYKRFDLWHFKGTHSSSLQVQDAARLSVCVTTDTRGLICSCKMKTRPGVRAFYVWSVAKRVHTVGGRR